MSGARRALACALLSACALQSAAETPSSGAGTPDAIVVLGNQPALLRASILAPRRPRVLLVTSDYHSARAAVLFRCAGADVIEAPVTLSLTEPERALRQTREGLARLYYLLLDECKRAGG